MAERKLTDKEILDLFDAQEKINTKTSQIFEVQGDTIKNLRKIVENQNQIIKILVDRK